MYVEARISSAHFIINGFKKQGNENAKVIEKLKKLQEEKNISIQARNDHSIFIIQEDTLLYSQYREMACNYPRLELNSYNPLNKGKR